VWEDASQLGRVMRGNRALLSLIDSIYEAVLDNELWPHVLVKIADAAGATQIAMASADLRGNVIAAIAPRTDPVLLAAYQDYWAFRDPVFVRAISRPAMEIYTLDSLMRREDFAATPAYNEMWRPAQWSLAMTGANVVVEDHFSALICVANAPGKDSLTEEQLRLFEALAQHISRAVRMNRLLWKLDLANLASAEQFEMALDGALLVDLRGRVVLANAAAKAMLDAGDGICLSEGRLAVAGSPDAVHKLVSSCVAASLANASPGGELTVAREAPKPPLRVTVAPLRSNVRLKDVPWIGVGSPAAFVTVQVQDRQPRQMDLRRRFDLTCAEAALAAEILKGDGRRAAAQRCGISDETAKTHLAHIFMKTGTHRQAELVRVLLGGAGGQDVPIFGRASP
jgi:DNA-binding CsgD family transcriptional regulator